MRWGWGFCNLMSLEQSGWGGQGKKRVSFLIVTAGKTHPTSVGRYILRKRSARSRSVAVPDIRCRDHSILRPIPQRSSSGCFSSTTRAKRQRNAEIVALVSSSAGHDSRRSVLDDLHVAHLNTNELGPRSWLVGAHHSWLRKEGVAVLRNEDYVVVQRLLEKRRIRDPVWLGGDVLRERQLQPRLYSLGAAVLLGPWPPEDTDAKKRRKRSRGDPISARATRSRQGRPAAGR